jgi:DNA-binding transcriptional LysR family regulator
MGEKYTRFNLNDIVLNRLKLRPLLIFYRVLQNHSIVHAARELNLTQPAVTKAVRELEQQLGTTLFERSNRSVTPTEYGLLLGERIKSVLAELRYLTDELNAFKTGNYGHVVVGTQISASARLLPRAIIRLKEQAPHIKVTVKEGPPDYLYPALITGKLDLVVGRLPESDMQKQHNMALTHRALYHNSLWIVCGNHHPLAQHKALTLNQLEKWPWILPPPDSPARQVADTFFQEADIPAPDNIVESLSLLTNVNVLQGSTFLGLMPTAAAQHFAAAKLLTLLPLPEVGPPASVGYTVREDKPLTATCRQLVECLKQTIEEDRGFSL